MPLYLKGTSSSANIVSALVDFGFSSGNQGDTASVTVSAPWVTISSVIVCSINSPSVDHSVDEAAVENILVYASNLNPGVGFDIVAVAPNGTWGTYLVNAMGV